MNIRLSGERTLVLAYATQLEMQFQAKGRDYPSRYPSDIRYYITVDDPKAEEVVASLINVIETPQS